jgi:hypothetical protein
MNDADAVRKMRELLLEFGSWTAIHKASTLAEDGVLVVSRRAKSPQRNSDKPALERSDG